MTFADVLKTLTARFEGSGFAQRPPRYPGVAVEIAPDRVTAVHVTADRKSKALTIRAVESRELPEGAIDPSITRPNILAPEPIRAALREILSRIGAGEQRISVLIPDHVARVALLSFASLPRTRRELTEIVRFRMAKSLPFKPEEAALDLAILPGHGGGPGPAGASILSVFIHRAVLEQYEALFAGAGYWPGLVGLSTFELYNLFRKHLEAALLPDRDSLFLNVTGHYQSLLIFRGDELIFYRCKPHPEETEGALAGLRREIYTSLAFYQEKLLGRGVGRVFLRSTGMSVEPLREAVRSEAGCEAEVLDLLKIVPLAGRMKLDPEDAARAAPAVGAVVGRRA